MSFHAGQGREGMWVGVGLLAIGRDVEGGSSLKDSDLLPTPAPAKRHQGSLWAGFKTTISLIY